MVVIQRTDYAELENYMDICYDEWQPFFAIIPKTTVSQQRAWGRCYRRQVRVYVGVEDWRYGWQYGNLFDLVRHT